MIPITSTFKLNDIIPLANNKSPKENTLPTLPPVSIPVQAPQLTKDVESKITSVMSNESHSIRIDSSRCHNGANYSIAEFSFQVSPTKGLLVKLYMCDTMSNYICQYITILMLVQ